MVLDKPVAVVAVVDTAHPGDTGPLERWMDANPLADILCVLGKTEGNGCVNDFTRGYATSAIQAALGRVRSRRTATNDEHNRYSRFTADPAIIMSGGTEGVLCPHFIVFANSWDEADADENHDVDVDAAFELHVTRTRDFEPEEVGTPVMAAETRRAIEEYLGGDGTLPNDIDDMFVQIKCPLLTPERIAEAAARGETCATTDCYKSMALSRGASAIGAAVASINCRATTLEGRLDDDYEVPNFYAALCEDYSFFSDRVSSSAGVELMHCEILMMLTRRRESSARSTTPGSKFRMALGRMDDAIDLAGVTRCVERARGPRGTNEIVAAIVKADPVASVRGRRTTMLSDSDIHATRHSRAAVGGVVAAAVGDCRVYVSGGAEHQGPDGGGPVCVISRVGARG